MNPNSVCYPLSSFLEEHADGKVYIRGTRMKVRLLAEELRSGSTINDMLEAHPHLKLAQVCSALSYYFSHQQEIDTEIDRLEVEVETARRQSRKKGEVGV